MFPFLLGKETEEFKDFRRQIAKKRKFPGHSRACFYINQKNPWNELINIICNIALHESDKLEYVYSQRNEKKKKQLKNYDEQNTWSNAPNIIPFFR